MKKLLNFLALNFLDVLMMAIILVTCIRYYFTETIGNYFLIVAIFYVLICFYRSDYKREVIRALRKQLKKEGYADDPLDEDKLIPPFPAMSKEYVDDLEHHRERTVGLYAFDKSPQQLINIFRNSRHDSLNIPGINIEQLEADWMRWCKSEDCIIFQIKE